MRKNLGGDLDQERVELALIPSGEDVGEFGVAQADHALEDVVTLGDQLHIAVLDAVVHHLDVMSCPAAPQIGDARRAVGRFGGDRLEQRLDQGVRLGRAAGHQARSVEGAFLAAADAHAQKADAQRRQTRLAPLSILKVAVAAIDDQVARLQERDELIDDRVDRGARLDHQQDAARLA